MVRVPRYAGCDTPAGPGRRHLGRPRPPRRGPPSAPSWRAASAGTARTAPRDWGSDRGAAADWNLPRSRGSASGRAGDGSTRATARMRGCSTAGRDGPRSEAIIAPYGRLPHGPRPARRQEAPPYELRTQQDVSSVYALAI